MRTRSLLDLSSLICRMVKIRMCAGQVHRIEGRTREELKALLDAAHRAMLEAFKVPKRDRYQIVHEHQREHMLVEDTGLGIERTDKVVFLQVTSRPRTREQKEKFYRLLCEWHCFVLGSVDERQSHKSL